MVVVGLMVGNQGRSYAMSDNTRHYVDLFWELVDEILNAILVVLIGLEIVMVSLNSNLLIAAILAVAIGLLARLIVVGGVTFNLQKYLGLPKGAWKVLTWGGLRGGISVALVLQLPAGAERDLPAITHQDVEADGTQRHDEEGNQHRLEGVIAEREWHHEEGHQQDGDDGPLVLQHREDLLVGRVAGFELAIFTIKHRSESPVAS